jgi:Tol biopolymer transport system component/nitrous oxidase accessory protein NosD
MPDRFPAFRGILAISIRTVGVAALIALAFACLPPIASATHVQCGDRILQDTTLDSDLTCDGDGLLLGGDEVTLDLGGHTLRGVRSEAEPVGIYMAASNATVRNGTIERFGYAITSAGSENVLFTGLVLREHDEAIHMSDSRNVRITDTLFDGTSGDGQVVMNGASTFTIAANEFRDTRILLGWGHGPLRGTVSDNVVTGGALIVYRDGDVAVLRNRFRDVHFEYSFESTGLVRRNVIANAPAGIILNGSSHPRVEHNAVFGSVSDGIRETDAGDGSIYPDYVPDPTPAVIIANDVHHNGDDGIDVAGGSCTRVEQNTTHDNGAHGIHMTTAPDPDVTCDGAQTIAGNRSFRNGLDGIHIADTNAEVSVRDNSADRNGDDGIDVDALSARYADPVWSPDGARVAFAADPVNGPWGIWLAAPDNSDTTFLTEGEHPAWSPDGTRIAFAKQGAGIYTIGVDGSGLRQVTDAGTRPRWSPDGATLLFERTGSLWTGPAGGGTPTLLASGQDAEWSPDGTRIAYIEGVDVYVIGADGSSQTWIWEGSDPTWSPDGQRVAFSDGSHLRVAAADGSGQEQITDSPCADRQDPCRRDLWPDWSADGARIVFTAADNTTGYEVYSVAPDGSGLEQLTETPEPPRFQPLVPKRDPLWSPDDRSVVFEDGDRIYALQPSGALVRLTVDSNPLVTLTANQANRNADLGIEAVDDVIDGARNGARHNGDPRQCVNVAC